MIESMTRQDAADMARAIEPQANAVLLAQTYAKQLRGDMDALDRRILAERDYCNAEGERITDPAITYELANDDFARFMARRAELIEKLAYQVPGPGYCPALMAEERQREAERALIEAAEPWTGIDVEIATRNLEHYRRLVELLTGLVVNREGYQKPELAA